MLEQQGNLWDVEADVHVLTTNGVVKANGECVMGAGVALQAKQLYPRLPGVLGLFINRFGNRPYIIPMERHTFLTMPVKHHWKDRASLTLIKRSAVQMVELVDLYGINSVAMVRPGCGNGQLDWLTVRNFIEHTLDNRFTVYER